MKGDVVMVRGVGRGLRVEVCRVVDCGAWFLTQAAVRIESRKLAAGVMGSGRGTVQESAHWQAQEVG